MNYSFFYVHPNVHVPSMVMTHIRYMNYLILIRLGEDYLKTRGFEDWFATRNIQED